MPKYNKFSLSNYKLATMKLGELVPIGLSEVLPGDVFNASTSALIRATPLLSPVMHPIKVRVHHFFVPHRLVWDDWENFITGGEDGADSSTFPTVDINGAAVGSLADYLGCPTGLGSAFNVSALPFRGYAKIWNEFYRDQQLETALTIDTTDGADTTTNTTLQNCAWEKDRFTSARPSEQLGSAVNLPIGSISSNSNTVQFTGQTSGVERDLDYSTSIGLKTDSGQTNNEELKFGTETGLQVSSTTINELREKFALQRYAEARNMYGARYTEYLRYIGVNPRDSRLDRPEYLGGGKQTIQFSEVLQQGQDFDANSGVGTLRGHGISALRTNRYKKYFEEHGYVFTLMSARPKTIYASGIDKTWIRSTKEDFFQKELQHIGQEEILNKEVYAAHTTPGGTFGYNDRYDEYRRQESSIAGQFRDSTYNMWHLARILSSDPSLNAAFVKCSPTARTFADQTNDQLLVMASHSIKAKRMMSKVGKPIGGL